jgi:hypothetical protein
VAKWTVGLEEELKRSKLAAVIISGTMNVTLSEFCQQFMNDGAPFGINRFHLSFVVLDGYKCVFFPSFHDFKSDHHLDLSPWVDNPAIGGQCRELKFIKPLKNVPGITESRGCKAQKICRFGSVGVILYSSTTMEDVPGCSTFTVEDMLVVRAVVW